MLYLFAEILPVLSPEGPEAVYAALFLIIDPCGFSAGAVFGVLDSLTALLL